jgi:hypothetical protein
VYVVNPGGWTEIDTVALITAEPLPTDYLARHRRAVAQPASRPVSRNGAAALVAFLIVIAAIAAGIVGAAHTSTRRAMRAVPSGITEVSWSDNAVQYRGNNGAAFTIHCPPGGSFGTVWGSDLYTDDSSLCTAAVHAGRLTAQAGGLATIEIRQGAQSYPASARFGVATRSYGPWSGSFVVR